MNTFRAVSFCLLVLCLTAFGQQATFTTLASFNGPNGFNPNGSGLVQGIDGNYYGTTLNGGNGTPSIGTGGTVFKMTPDGTLTALYNFCSKPNCTDGWMPQAGLILANDGAFYGTTDGGGIYNLGSIFKITLDGTLTTLHSFSGIDGELPNSYASLLQANDGNFYGTTFGGGTPSANCSTGCGTIFTMTPDGTVTTLYSFDKTLGYQPNAGLIQGIDGNFYGMTPGVMSGPYCADCGTVFQMTPDGIVTNLHTFHGPDGSIPVGGPLVQGADGNFYGTTAEGGSVWLDGCGNGCGTIFKITTGGTLTTLYNFCSQPACADGMNPFGGLVRATDGNFYGATQYGGANAGSASGGTLFEITPTGTLTTLYSFCSQPNCADGIDPTGVIMMQSTNGNFYGTTEGGGVYGGGTIYSLSLGLSPFDKPQPTSGNVGTSVNVLVSHLNSATQVTFNGKPAKFKLVSPTLIKTVVPSGATSGKVKVVTPRGTLSSNVVFRVHR